MERDIPELPEKYDPADRGLRQIISGGQTGVDRAALDAAAAAGLEIGGWCPLGRQAEDGPIPAHYPLTETATADPAERTRRNIDDADGTLILVAGTRAGVVADGTRLTADHARQTGTPLLEIDLDDAEAANLRAIRRWIVANRIHSLNVAGPRESTCPGIGERAGRLLSELFAARQMTS